MHYRVVTSRHFNSYAVSGRLLTDTREDSRAMHNSERMCLKSFLETFGAQLPSRIQMIKDLQHENELAQQSAELQAKLYGIL